MSHVRKLIPTILLLSTLTAHAQSSPTPGQFGAGHFVQQKQRVLARIAQRIQVLQTLQLCVQSSTDRELENLS